MMRGAYPELAERAGVVNNIVQAEETSFRRTLDRGLQKLNEAIDAATKKNQSSLLDDFVGDLYATDGFPIDLTRLIAEESGLTVDERRAHDWVIATHGAADTKVGEEAVAPIYKNILEQHGPTTFTGYETLRTETTVLALVHQGQAHESVTVGQDVEVIAAETPMYGRAGGQVGDTGTITGDNGSEIAVTDAIKPGGSLIIHQGKVTGGSFKKGAAVEIATDGDRRQAIRLNHSATHLLHHALRTALGDHVAQKGSEVAPEQLRFDFSHFEAMTPEQIRRVETMVNDEIRRNGASSTERMPFEEAQKLGAMALFGEKYADEVRVVRVGSQSIELCGGTHVGHTGEIGLFRIISEEALALGVRRIVALTGAGAVSWVQQQLERLGDAARLLRCSPGAVTERVEKLQAQVKEQERHLDQLKRKLATGGGTDLLTQAREVSGVKVLATRVDAADPKTLRQAGDTFRDRMGTGIVVLGGIHKDKAALLVMVSKDLTHRYHAGKLVSKLAEVVGGKGGGRPDMAQAGGPRSEKLDEALALVHDLL
jgi:alanyl-tRNA synthetase